MIENEHCGFYKNKTILAPMVRMCTLPFRLLALDYGADMVYCEELVDYRLIQTERTINDVLGTIDYVDKTDGTITFRTCSAEKSKLILQIGTCDPDRAAKVATMVENDVAGIDINMGCPKEFSIKGGMGAALLNDVDKACSILQSVVNAVKVPVTCKIRVLSDTNKTIEFCKKLESTGISAIAVHGRTRKERPHHPNRNYMLKELCSNLKIPIIANGGSQEINCYDDIEKFRQETNCSSVMIARAAQHNCCIFRKEGRLPLDDVIERYLRYAVDYDNSPSNTKYCVQSMLRDLQTTTSKGRKFLESQTLQQMCHVWDIGDYCHEKEAERMSRGSFGRWGVKPKSVKNKEKPNCSFSEHKDVLSLRCSFLRNFYKCSSDVPKNKLLMLAHKQRITPPKYQTLEVDKLFTSMVVYNGKKYSSSYWQKNKRWSEQGAAIVCLCYLGIYDAEQLKKDGVIR